VNQPRGANFDEDTRSSWRCISAAQNQNSADPEQYNREQTETDAADGGDAGAGIRKHHERPRHRALTGGL